MSRIRVAVDFDSEEYAIDWMAEPVRRNWGLRRAGARFGGTLEGSAR